MTDSRRSSRYHRAEWGTAVHVGENLTRVRLKNPRAHLMVNSYVWREDGVFLVIDPGWPWTLDALATAFDELGFGAIEDVTHWLYTHSHIDHMGLAAILGKRSEAPHLIAERVEPHLLTWHSFQDRMNDWSTWAGEAFASPMREVILQIFDARDASGERRGMVATWGEGRVTRSELFAIGEVLSIGSLELEVHDASGHDPTHVAFFAREQGWLFSGDAVLAVPTPITPAMGDAVAPYEETLSRLRALEATSLFPGHGTQIEGGREAILAAIDRAHGFILSHRAALRALFLSTDEPLDLYNIALAITPEQRPLEPPVRWHVHISSTDAHLKWLLGQKEIVCVDDERGPFYRRSE